MFRHIPLLGLVVPLILGGCATVTDDQSEDRRILASQGAYRLLQKNGEATAVYKAHAGEAESELICERILYEGYKDIRTFCYARDELEGTQRQHRETFQDLTLFPGSGG